MKLNLYDALHQPNEIIKSLKYFFSLSEKDYQNMSLNCRKLAEEVFDVRIVINKYLKQIQIQI